MINVRIKYIIFTIFFELLFLSYGTAIAQSDSISITPAHKEEMASFPGGAEALKSYLDSTLNYPEFALDNNIQGTVLISVLVKKDGSLEDIKIHRDIGGGCGQEAEKVVRLMPNWNPGKIDDDPVNVRLVIPVKFYISDELHKAWKAEKKSRRKPGKK